MGASVEPLLHLIQPAGPGWVGVEIGVNEGFSSERLLQRGIRFLYLIDPWRSYPDYREDPASAAAKWEDKYHAALRRLEAYGRHTVLRMPSADAARLIPPQMDFVWVDGNHQYEYVKSDIELYWPKLKPGGLLCGDDYTNNEPGGTCEVKRAVDEFVRGMGLRLELYLPCWAVRKP